MPPEIGIVLGPGKGGESEGGESPPASKPKPMGKGMGDASKQARLDALKEFFDAGKAGDFEAADLAWADFKACCDEGEGEAEGSDEGEGE